MRITVPKTCKSVDTADGARYVPDARGRVEIEAPNHVKALRQNTLLEHCSAPVTGFDVDDGAAPCGCGFRLFRWQRECPRCGAPVERSEV